jgi:hypothetical protein
VWDIAAARRLDEEAGGRLTDTALRELRYNTKESLLNPHFFVFGSKSRDWSRELPESCRTPASHRLGALHGALHAILTPSIHPLDGGGRRLVFTVQGSRRNALDPQQIRRRTTCE